MAHYSISKRVRKNQTVYCARVRSKESGVVTFSTSKTFHSKAAAAKWAKNMVHKVERQLIDIDMGLVDCTMNKLIQKAMFL